jgi:hypothetical protein
MTKECELLLAIAARKNCGSTYITLLKKLTESRYLSIPQPLERGNITNGITNARQILKQRPPHSITKRAR